MNRYTQQLSRRIAVALASAALFTASAFSSAASAADSGASSGASAPAQTRSVRFGYGVRVVGPDAAAYTSVPIKEGFWHSQGMDVTIQPLNAGPAFQLLAQGELDFLTGGSAGGMPLVEKGAKIIGVAVGYNLNIFYPAVLADSDITSLKQIKGKSIGLFTPAGAAPLMLDAVLHEYGLTKADLKSVVAVGTGAPAVNALKSKQIDIYFGYQGAYNTIEATTDVKFRRFNDNPLVRKTAFASPCIWTREELVKNDPQLVLGFLRGIVMGIKFSKADPTAAIKDHFALFPHTKPRGTDAQAIKQGVDSLTVNLTTLSDPYGSAEPGSVEATARIMQQAGVIKKVLPASEYYVGTFIKPANQVDMDLVNKALGKK